MEDNYFAVLFSVLLNVKTVSHAHFSFGCQLCQASSKMFNLQLAIQYFSVGCNIFSTWEYAFIFHVLLLGRAVMCEIPMWHFPSCTIVNGSWPISSPLCALRSLKREPEFRGHFYAGKLVTSHITDCLSTFCMWWWWKGGDDDVCAIYLWMSLRNGYRPWWRVSFWYC